MNSQFAVAVHVLSLIAMAPESARSSEDIAASVGTNAVVIRGVIGRLRAAGLLQTQRGVAGARLSRPSTQVTLLDVYRAMNGQASVFKLHEGPNPRCPVGANIQGSLEAVLGGAQRALEAQLSGVTLADLATDLLRRAG